MKRQNVKENCTTENNFRLCSDELNRAIIFATEKHREQVRKGTTIPYILHPLEVLQILYSMRAETNVMIAGVLHDTVEDTDTSLEEIKEIFGEDVATLIASNSEDKSKTWDERKQHTISDLKNADKRVKMLIMADKLSNIRSIAYDYKNIGDELWKRFNAPKEKQAWYYGGVQDSLYDMQFYPECSDLYWEFVGLYKDVFVKFFLDESESILYQICDDGSAFFLNKGNPEWYDAGVCVASDISVKIDMTGKKQYVKSSHIPDGGEELSRKDAELLEDMWNKTFWDCHNDDMKNGTYHLFGSENRCIDIKITDSCLVLLCEDYGKECAGINGKDEYEFSYSLDEESTHRILVRLRIMHGLEIELEDALKREFGTDNGSVLFENMCRELNINPKFFCN
ncbi:MAG: bifunctional (p)ppGpp synthetase/guanosine-3',5'-bis(diphosphate) 3'-pyrophosphohydrolase [Clostridia bacterium]|nr:bifunctional (p)ppGpp synthetase/guanosine-3',5'-bis(diphosphate) 3'-pyrophosphohydrolase [Clostridia bacterium]